VYRSESMIDEREVRKFCGKYNIKYKYFPQTNIVILDTGFDEWQIKYNKGKEMPYSLLHKNIFNKKFHTQRKLRTLFQTIDSVVRHKNVLLNIYDKKKYKSVKLRNMSE